MSLGEESRLPSCPCPYCDHQLDRASRIDGKGRPQPGDWTVCINCAQILLFRYDLTLQKPSPAEEQRVMAAHPELQQRLQLVADIVRRLDRRTPNRADRRRMKRQERRRNK